MGDDHLSATKLIKKSEDDLFDLSDKLQIDNLANCEVYDDHRSFNKSFLIESKNEIKIKEEKYLTDINIHEKMDVQKTIAEQNLNEFNQNKENENLVTFEKSIITGQDVINTLNQSKEYENNSILDKSSQSEEHDHLVRSEVVDEIDSIVDKSSHFEELDLLNLPIKTHNKSQSIKFTRDYL
ncbi:hypothetical protein TSAR_010559 [Trichomalopsis sarcophagae]|uniref:Uncharacterized protein n=1 Tax=Trichomalopsis sarcophagae TaxID=543379 RepID=A0A232EKU8_9HYME|nr:hypothetical protein TSAR_010559 [Trichomalopsis sarcophagae]